jgi:drug/metabolite transporter (DMT)-like permease
MVPAAYNVASFPFDSGVRLHSERTRIWLSYLTACLVWGSTWLAIKVGLRGVPPLLGAGLRFLLASAILYAVIKVARITIPRTPEAKHIYAVLAVLSYTIPFAFVYWSEQFIPTGLASILFAAFPFWVGIFSHIMLAHERLTIFKVSGIIIGFAGIVIIFAHDLRMNDSHAFVAMLMMLASPIMQAYCLVLVKKYGQPISPFAFTCVGMFFSSILLLILSVVLEAYDAIVWNAETVGSILYLATVGSVVVFVVYYWLLKRVQALYLSLISFITPIIAVVLGAVVLNEKLHPRVYIGASLVLVGLLVANGRYFLGRMSEVFD